VPGVGNKTAAKWLTQYDGLDGVIANAGAIGGKAGQSLRDHLEGVIRNRQLNRLVDDLELPLTVDDLRVRAWDREQVHQVFDGLEFRVLRDRLFSTLSAAEPEAEGGFEPRRRAPGRRRRPRLARRPRRHRAGRLARGGHLAGGPWRRDRDRPGHRLTAPRASWTSSAPRPRPSPTLAGGWRTPTARRCSTTPRVRSPPSPNAPCRWRASPATRRSPPTSSGPTSAASTSPT
jgi:DNA polymerase-1